MASAEVEKPTEPVPAPAVPDYLASPNAVFGDEGVKWRYGRAPDYSKTRKVWEESKHPSSMTLLIHGRGILWQARGFLCDVPRVPNTMWQNDHKISKGWSLVQQHESSKLTPCCRQEDEPRRR